MQKWQEMQENIYQRQLIHYLVRNTRYRVTVLHREINNKIFQLPHLRLFRQTLQTWEIGKNETRLLPEAIHVLQSGLPRVILYQTETKEQLCLQNKVSLSAQNPTEAAVIT